MVQECLLVSANLRRTKESIGQKKYEHQQKDKIKKLVDALSLTEQQETQLTAIIEKHKVSMKEMDKGMKEKFQHAREQKIAEINAILTPDQQLKFKELIEKYKKRGKKHHRSQEH